MSFKDRLYLGSGDAWSMKKYCVIRCSFFLFPSCWSRILIVFWSGSHSSRHTHHEHLRYKGSILGMVYHLGLLRWKWLFKDNRVPFEKATNFRSSGKILSVVIFLINEVGILRFPLQRFTADDLGGPCFEASTLAFPLRFFFPFEDLSAVVDWTTWTSKAFLGPDGFQDELLGIAFETHFYLKEV